jgi:iodotyrosine deiodinase
MSKFVKLEFERQSEAEMLARAEAFDRDLQRRRSVRHFSPDPIPESVLRTCIRSAGSAPSGAHKQPWTFVVVTDPDIKRRVRAAAEEEERANYGGRMNERWIEDLEPLGTDAQKPFLETAPALIVVMRQAWGEDGRGGRAQHYYTQESVGLAAGFLLAALHHAGLATLTHTPSPMGFLSEVLGRPALEKPFLLIPVGYPAADCEVPDLARKDLDELIIWR